MIAIERPQLEAAIQNLPGNVESAALRLEKTHSKLSLTAGIGWSRDPRP